MVARDQLLKAIEQVESGGRRDAVSPKGARGRMQVMPATARQPGYRVKPARDESEEEYTRVGKDYAMALLKNYGGDLEATLVAYNYGPGNANKWIASGRNKSDLPKETRDYITKVGKQLGGKNMATKKQLTDQRKALQRKVRSGSATDADKRKLKRIQIELGSKGKTTAKAKASASEVKRRNTSLQREAASRKAEAGRRAALQQLMEDSLPLDEDVAGRALDQGAYAKYSEPQRAALNKALQRERTPSDFERTPQRGGAFIGSPPLQRRADDIALPFNRTTGNRGTMRPPNVDPDLQRGVSRVPRGDMRIGPSSPEITEAQFSYTDPGTIPTEDQFRAMRDTPRGSDTPIRENTQADYVSSGGRGKMAGNKGYETLREYFIEDMTPRKSNVMTPFGIIEIDSTQEGMFPEEGMYSEKKGGRLKKKKRVARKKAAPKKKKVAAKKKPVVRKKAVAKKPPMRKKTVAKKPAGRKRAAKRGFGAELRGN